MATKIPRGRKTHLFFPLVFTAFLFSQNALAKPEINYDPYKHLLSIHAEETSFKALLHDVEIKTGIKIIINGRIADKYITLSTNQLPIDCIGDLLYELSINNVALLYDQKGNITEIFILPEGTAMPQVPRVMVPRSRYW